MPEGVPTNEVIELQGAGKATSEITEELQAKGYTLPDINEAINQASIKAGVGGGAEMTAPVPDVETMQESILVPEAAPPPPTPDMEPMPEVPQPGIPAPAYPEMEPVAPSLGSGGGMDYEEVQALVEEVIEEKWKELISNVGDLTAWKTQVTVDTDSIKQELLRVEKRFETMQGAVMGKVRDYGTSMNDLGSDIKALEKVFEKIIEPLTTNVKELDRITKKMKDHK